MENMERRSFLADVVVDEGRKISGYAAVFDCDSVKMGGFVERIEPGAFAKTLRQPDVRALLEHDPRWLLGNTASGTLRLEEDHRGLKIEIDPPDTTAGRDAVESLKRGDLKAMSFGFKTVRDSWASDGSQQVRTLHEVTLFDVSLVAFPAYPDTTVALRSLQDAAPVGPGLHKRKLEIAEAECFS